MTTEISPQEYISKNTDDVSSISKFGFTKYRRFIGCFRGYPLAIFLGDSNYLEKELIFGEFVTGLDSVEPEKERFAIYGSVEFYVNRRTKIFNPLNFAEDEFEPLIERYQSYKLFIDDIREPQTDGWLVARTSAEAIAIMVHRGCAAQISFDHDLGGEDTAMRVVRWMIEHDLDSEEKFIQKDFKFNVHSANPVGRENLNGLLHGYLQMRIENKEDQMFLNAVERFLESVQTPELLFNAKLYTTEKTLLQLLQLPDRRLIKLLQSAQSDLSVSEFKDLLNQIHVGPMQKMPSPK